MFSTIRSINNSESSPPSGDCISGNDQASPIGFGCFSKLGNDIVLLAKLAESYGIQIFSYADPCAGVTILGPKRLKMLTSTFTFPLLKQLDAQLNSQDVVVLCPKTALALIASELAVWKEHPLPQMTTYTEALFSLQEQIRFCGQTCINQNPSLQRFLEIKLTDESSD